MSCPYELNDGAYILGALAPAERAEFEHHLATCPSCRESVATLAGLPGLLGRLEPATVLSTGGTLATGLRPSPDLLPRVLAAARTHRRAQRRRHLLTTVAAGVAAAVLATIIGLGVQLVTRHEPSAVLVEPVQFTTMQPGAGYPPVDAEIGIRTEATGTVVRVRCLYHGQGEQTWPIWLVVYPRSANQGEAIGSWMARPGQAVSVTATTRFTPAQIDRIELQSGGDHSTIAWWRP